jgi:hypothetical protein
MGSKALTIAKFALETVHAAAETAPAKNPANGEPLANRSVFG